MLSIDVPRFYRLSPSIDETEAEIVATQKQRDFGLQIHACDPGLTTDQVGEIFEEYGDITVTKIHDKGIYWVFFDSGLEEPLKSI
jgi:hypothetical protein